ncbi:hypothetical protein EJ03DRAFT_340671 [Teratosphaeria nubilosa]|uniref:Integral membrane protein n=1 Tax=Teratosphaeria nubilosa TaxID=161662 RepID=A0A6G1LLG3_9PEZI|nr:hypothetical protein EJ03DRAFT_340671 [Teratosphaeria nubilosa]
MDSDTPTPDPSPSVWRWVLAFLLVGAAWGLTTPLMRRAAVKRNEAPQPERPTLSNPNVPWIRRKIWGVIYAVLDLLKNPAYAVPLLLNITGSVWFFILVGQAELSLTVPITNSLAFLFTVLGEWYAEGKGISRDTWIGVIFVLGGVALCVQSKAG